MKVALAVAALSLIAAPVALSASAAAAQQDPAERARIEDLTRRLNAGPPAPQSAAPSEAAAVPASVPALVAPRPAPAPVAQTTPPAAARQDAAERARIEDLTRRLNGAPPVSAPAPRPIPASQPAPQSAPVQPAPVQTTPQPQPSRATEAAPVRRPPVAQSAPVSIPAPAPAQATTPAAPARLAPAPSPQGLSAAERAALPFRIDLPADAQLIEGRAGPDARVFSVRKAGKTYLMIYAGPSSQFPIYDGEQVTVGGRQSVVTTDGPRRVAMEHLFQRADSPAEIHVWLMSLDGAERDQAERIGQSVDPR